MKNPAKSNGTPPSAAVLECPIAGSWYPGNPAELRASIEKLMPEPRPEKMADIRGMLLPHAGHMFSGRVAMEVFARIDPAGVERVVVLAPSHYVGISDRVLLSDSAGFRTPLGTVEADPGFTQNMQGSPATQIQALPFQREHSFWIQLPLLQFVLGNNFRIVPMIVGRLRSETRDHLANRLRSLLDERTLVIASSDFTHYGERFGYVPFTSNVPEKIRDLDQRIAERVTEKDVAGFNAMLDETGATVCGRDPIALWIGLMPNNIRLAQIDYDTSGRQTGDWETSVSYCAILARGSWTGASPSKKPAPRHAFLDKEDRDRLLRLARQTLTETLSADPPPASSEAPEPDVTPGMEQKAGGFVTLREQGKLRGCIGEIFPSRPIWRVVRENVIHAALNDPRFPPVGHEELDAIVIEISALTPPHPVAGPEHIETGRHGIVLSKQGRQAVFLPQVATEQGWNLEQTLSNLSRKAGLPSDAWREGADFLVFEAQVFAEPLRRQP